MIQLCLDAAECEFQSALRHEEVSWELAWPEAALGDVLSTLEAGNRREAE